jgi:hypothetical protein
MVQTCVKNCVGNVADFTRAPGNGCAVVAGDIVGLSGLNGVAGVVMVVPGLGTPKLLPMLECLVRSEAMETVLAVLTTRCNCAGIGGRVGIGAGVGIGIGACVGVGVGA